MENAISRIIGLDIGEERTSVPEVPVKKQAILTAKVSSPCVWWGLVIESVIRSKDPNVPPFNLDFDGILKFFRENCKKWVFQEEKSDKGHEHYQCLAGFKKKIRKEQLLDWVANELGIPLICVSVKKIKNGWKFKPYCVKLEGRLNGPWGHDLVKPPTLLRIEDFYAWQAIVWDEIVKGPNVDNRVIHWIWDEAGSTGKTQLVKKLCYERGALLFSGKSSDICSRVVTADQPPDICIMNITRDLESYVSYQSIECLKDDLVSTGKYEGGQKIWDSPYVFIFANFEPRYGALSKDRWNVRSIKQLTVEGKLYPDVKPKIPEMFNLPADEMYNFML